MHTGNSISKSKNSDPKLSKTTGKVKQIRHMYPAVMNACFDALHKATITCTVCEIFGIFVCRHQIQRTINIQTSIREWRSAVTQQLLLWIAVFPVCRPAPVCWLEYIATLGIWNCNKTQTARWHDLNMKWLDYWFWLFGSPALRWYCGGAITTADI